MRYVTLFHSISISLLLIILPHFFFKFSIAISSIAQNQTLPDNNSTLVSPNGNFELGFFSPWNSSNRYVGIWFAKVLVRTVVWVANKNSPITNSSGILSLTSSGGIIISSNQSPVWTANLSSTNLTFPVVLKLLDNGNLVLNNADSPDDGSFLWQSFDNPCDTLLPGMKLGWDLTANQEWYLTSWKSIDDPSTGEFTYRMNPKGPPSIVLRRGSNIIYRSGPWDGVRFGGAPHSLQQNPVFAPTFVFNSTHVYYTFENTDDSTISRFVVTESGKLTQFLWRETSDQWIDITTLQADPCDEYAKCGNFGVCEFGGAPICACLTGFTPRLRDDWARFDWMGGCIRETELNCSTPAGFRKFSDMKVPDTFDSFVNGSARNREECEAVCLRTCGCAAYANTPKIGCVLWSGDLLDIRVYGSGGLDLFVKMPLSELDESKNSKKVAVIASLTVASFILLAIVIWFIIRRRTGNKRRAQQHDYPNQDNKESIGDEDVVLPLIDFHAISAATNEFSYANKVGEGGFGSVYKGVLSTGEEIAVKRLSRDSGQGLHEFKNEVILIAKLQHRNLVRLLGCCIHRDERMLVYEFMPNKSLDHFIFDQTKETSLEWQTRFDIIVGIARGLLYLHRDSRLRIIHRDLKASNVLLDSEMNPKISDFGLARTFGADQYQENTKRVMGTYGYMAPEYAVDGIFSVKSDVFSFGVLILEIISGKKNRGFYHTDHDLNLLGHAWKLWTEGNPEDFIDASAPLLHPEKVLRCIQVGLLCVQQRADDRPTMSNALFMLESDHLELDQPKQPGFYAERSIFHTDSSSTGNKPDTSNQITDTLLHGR